MKPILSAIVLALATVPASAFAFNTGSLMPSLTFTDKSADTVSQDKTIGEK